MAKLLLFSIFTCISLSLTAQVKQDSIIEHVKFKGIEIDGNIKEFIKKMKKAGFSYDRAHSNKIASMSGTDNVILMSGKFTGKPCDAYIQITPKSKIVCKIVIHFVEKTWDELKKEYFDTKDIFFQKYGKPFSELQCFEYPYHEGDRNELQALKDGKCKYYSFYKAKNGGIVVEISKFNTVSITSGNDINLKKGKQEYEERLLNEI